MVGVFRKYYHHYYLRKKLPVLTGTIEIQFGRPSSDVTDGGWLTHLNSATDLYDQINESVADDSDYIKSSTIGPSSDDTVEILLSTLNDPGRNDLHKIRYRYRKTIVDLSPTMDLTVSLIENTTIIASWSHTNVGTDWEEAEQTLSEAEADSITDYSNLRLRFTAENSS